MQRDRIEDDGVNEPILLYATAPTFEIGQDLARMLVEKHAAACVNILPGMTSVYRWNEKVETAQEVVLLIKTTRAAAGIATARLVEAHPYEVPCVVALCVVKDSSNAEFLSWISAQIQKQ